MTRTEDARDDEEREYPDDEDRGMLSIARPGNTRDDKPVRSGILLAEDESPGTAGAEKGPDDMLFETHAHYDNGRFDTDREELLSALPGAGIGWVVNPGCDLPTSRTAVALAGKFPHVYAAVGFHPSDCAGCEGDWLEEIRALAQSSPKVVAIGEIGLDYYWKDNPPRERQQAVFRAQLALAEELACRSSFTTGRPIRTAWPSSGSSPGCGVYFTATPAAWRTPSCWCGWAGTSASPGWSPSKTARKALEVAAALPADRIMLETDSPYLAPEPNRGRRNDSRNLVYIRDRIAQLRGVSPEELEEQTTQNALQFFGIRA